jgi:hypothetical protein
MRVSPLPETLADAGSRIAAASGIDAKRGWESSLLAANLNQADFPDDPVAKSTDPHQNVFFLICAGSARTNPSQLDKLLNGWAQDAIFERDHGDRPRLIWKCDRQYFQKPFLDV